MAKRKRRNKASVSASVIACSPHRSAVLQALPCLPENQQESTESASDYVGDSPLFRLDSGFLAEVDGAERVGGTGRDGGNNHCSARTPEKTPPKRIAPQRKPYACKNVAAADGPATSMPSSRKRTNDVCTDSAPLPNASRPRTMSTGTSECSGRESETTGSDAADKSAYSFRQRRLGQNYYGPHSHIGNFGRLPSSGKRSKQRSEKLSLAKRGRKRTAATKETLRRQNETNVPEIDEEATTDENCDANRISAFGPSGDATSPQKNEAADGSARRPRPKSKRSTARRSIGSESDARGNQSSDGSRPTSQRLSNGREDSCRDDERLRNGLPSQSSSDSSTHNGHASTADGEDADSEPLSRVARIMMRFREWSATAAGVPQPRYASKTGETPKRSRKRKQRASSDLPKIVATPRRLAGVQQTPRRRRSKKPVAASNWHPDRLFGHIDPAQYAIDSEVAEREIADTKYIRYLNDRHLKYIFDQNLNSLQAIFEGKEFSRRHDDFKRGGRANWNLTYQVFMQLFSEAQLDFIMELLVWRFCKTSNRHIDYVLKVLFPEMLIRIHMKKKSSTREESERHMLAAAYTAPEDDSEIEPCPDEI